MFANPRDYAFCDFFRRHVVRCLNIASLEDGHQLTLDDEEKATDKTQNSIHVVFDIEGTRTATPDIVEYVPKSLSYSCMHMALSDINPPARADGLPPAPLLARDIVLGRLPLEFQEERQDLSAWHLNSSQEQAVCRALARHFQLLHGPPGTGKTRTAAVLMTLFAQRNLGARCAILFGAPTNRAVDCALLYRNQLCESYFAERLRARVEQDGDAECAICLDANPDVVAACGHVFHRTCLARCLQESSQCPLCRQILKQPRGGLRMLRVICLRLAETYTCVHVRNLVNFVSCRSLTAQRPLCASLSKRSARAWEP